MLLRNQSISHATLFALVVGLPTAGCSLTGEIETGIQGQNQRGDSRDGAPGDEHIPLPLPPELPVECKTLDFDVDSDGVEIDAARILNDVYANDGVRIEAFRDPKGRLPGLPVAFDSDNPTGGDDDLAFDGLGNLLISQECWEEGDIERGFISREPDDNAGGARFEFTFDESVCIPGLTLLDVDLREEPVYIKFFDADGNRVFETSVPPMGNNVRIDVTLPEQEECNVAKAVVKFSGSGAMDNVEICETPDAGDTEVIDAPRLDGDQQGGGVAADAFGNILVAGTDGDNIFLRKLDPNGEVLFQKNIAAGTGAEVAVLLDRNPVVFGNNPDGTLYLAGLDAAGNVVRTPSLAGLGEARAVDVTTIGSDIFFVADVADSGDVVVGKVDATNNVELATPFNSGGLDNAAAISMDSAGNIAVAVNGNGTFVVTYDADLNQSNIIPLAGLLDADFGIVTGVAYDSVGHLLVVGDEQGLTTTIRLLKLDADGTLITQTTFVNDSDDDMSAGVTVDSADNVIVAGSVVNGDGNFDVWVRKVDSNLDRLFPRQIDVSGNDIVNDVTTDFAGNIIVTGQTDGDGDDVLTIKLNP